MNWEIIKDCRRKLASEIGTINKDWGGRIHIALIYPNSYAVGMSNLGLQAIYGLSSSYDQIVIERIFFEGHEPVSLESQRPLGDFDIFAFSFSYEHDYFNAVRILKSSGIPPFSADRDEHHPIVIAGGAAITANPEPIARFMDCFAIGEAEVILPQMIEVFTNGPESPRHELINELAKIPGVYVPSIGSIPVARQAVEKLDSFQTHSVVMSPHTELGDMYLIEIGRGCARGCRFCLAGCHFRPMRYRTAEKLIEQVKTGLHYRNRIGLVSAAISDHPQIEELVLGLRRINIDFSVSSIRIKPLPEVLLKGLAESGTKTITLAPEAGSEKLRKVIGKGISEDDILNAISRAIQYDFKQIKLYFMIGLPTENDGDIVEITRLVRSVKQITDQSRSGIQIILNITPFVPKAGTPFQWSPMAGKNVLKKRLKMLQKELPKKGIEVKSDSIEWSLVQGMLSRGSSLLGSVMEQMEKPTLSAWHQELIRAGIDPESIYHQIPINEPLPWDRINSGPSYDRLRLEFENTVSNGN